MRIIRKSINETNKSYVIQHKVENEWQNIQQKKKKNTKHLSAISVGEFVFSFCVIKLPDIGHIILIIVVVVVVANDWC